MSQNYIYEWWSKLPRSTFQLQAETSNARATTPLLLRKLLDLTSILIATAISKCGV